MGVARPAGRGVLRVGQISPSLVLMPARRRPARRRSGLWPLVVEEPFAEGRQRLGSLAEAMRLTARRLRSASGSGEAHPLAGYINRANVVIESHLRSLVSLQSAYPSDARSLLSGLSIVVAGPRREAAFRELETLLTEFERNGRFVAVDRQVSPLVVFLGKIPAVLEQPSKAISSAIAISALVILTVLVISGR